MTLVVHDFGGLIGLPLALGPGSPVRRLVVITHAYHAPRSRTYIP